MYLYGRLAAQTRREIYADAFIFGQLAAQTLASAYMTLLCWALEIW